MADIRISSLRKEFGAFSAVRDVNITVGNGEFVFLLGPRAAARPRRCA